MSAISSLGPSRIDHFDPTDVVGPTMSETPASVDFGLTVLSFFQRGLIDAASSLVENSPDTMAQLLSDDEGLYYEIQEWVQS